MTVDTSGSGAGTFVGRAAELEILKTAADAAKGGRFSTILISGEPGIGKTRLVEEACNTLARWASRLQPGTVLIPGAD